MTIADVVSVLEGEVVCGHDKLNHPVRDFAASDLLSDILQFEKEDYALITGLTNAQIVRTAEITNARCIVMVRNKMPQQGVGELAHRSGIPLILSKCSMYEACRRLGFFERDNVQHAGAEGTPDPSGP